MKKKVICDTNIWYNLGQGTLDKELSEENDLVATFYNFDELNTTYNILKDSDKVINTSKAIVDYSRVQILENAILYLVRTIKQFYVDERYTYNLGMRSWNEVRLLSKLELGTKLPKWAEDMYKQNILTKENEGVNIAKTENLLSESVRKEARKAYKSDKEKYFESVSKSIIALLNYYLKEFTGGTVEFPSGYNYRNIELFLNAFVEYVYKLDVAGMRVQPNDAFDLYNLVYVRPGMKYFTLEKRWNRIIEDCGMKDYIFLP